MDEEVDPPSSPKEGKRNRRILRFIFLGWCYSQVVQNWDSGVLPATLGLIKEEFDLKPWHQGFLGGLTYIGLTITSPIAGYLLQRKSPKMIVGTCLALNMLFTILLAASWNAESMFVARAGIGLAQAATRAYGVRRPAPP